MLPHTKISLALNCSNQEGLLAISPSESLLLLQKLYYLNLNLYLSIGQTNENDKCAGGYPNKLLQEEEIRELLFLVF